MAGQAKYHFAMAEDSFAGISPEIKAHMPVYVWQKRYETAFSTYAAAVVEGAYASDADVLADYELQALKEDLVDPQGANYNSEGFLPRSTFESKSALTHFLSWVLTSQGFKHHLMNHRMMRDMMWCFPHRLSSLHMRFDTTSYTFEGLPRPDTCPVDAARVSEHTTYTGAQIAAGVNAAATLAAVGNNATHPAYVTAAASAAAAAELTTAYHERLHATAEGFSPNFAEIPDLMASGYAHNVHDHASLVASEAFARNIADIEADLITTYGTTPLRSGAFKWTPMYATPTQPVI